MTMFVCQNKVACRVHQETYRACTTALRRIYLTLVMAELIYLYWGGKHPEAILTARKSRTTFPKNHFGSHWATWRQHDIWASTTLLVSTTKIRSNCLLLKIHFKNEYGNFQKNSCLQILTVRSLTLPKSRFQSNKKPYQWESQLRAEGKGKLSHEKYCHNTTTQKKS